MSGLPPRVDAAGNDMAEIARGAAEHDAKQKRIGSHHCHAIGCAEVVAPEMLMCKPHWFSLPAVLRKRVLIAYTPGQCNDIMRIKPAWVAAARAAIENVLMRDLPELVKRLHLPEGYDGAKVEVQRVGMGTVAIRREGLPLLVGSLATGEVREVPKPPADNDPGDEQPGAA